LPSLLFSSSPPFLPSLAANPPTWNWQRCVHQRTGDHRHCCPVGPRRPRPRLASHFLRTVASRKCKLEAVGVVNQITTFEGGAVVYILTLDDFVKNHAMCLWEFWAARTLWVVVVTGEGGVPGYWRHSVKIKTV
jgi:hypothetical protein